MTIYSQDGTVLRRGDWMQTYTGRKFWPLDPRPEDVCIADIAHSLSMQARYAGHGKRFYSVAEHCVHVAAACGAEASLWGLLHDASEAYLVDVPRPLKRYLPGYAEAEARVMTAICDAFGLPHEMPLEVHERDNRILADEIRQNMAPMEWHVQHDDPLGVDLCFWSPQMAEEEFLLEFDCLTSQRSAA